MEKVRAISERISVCLFCYQAVVQISMDVRSARCVHCGRMFRLDLFVMKRMAVGGLKDGGEKVEDSH